MTHRTRQRLRCILAVLSVLDQPEHRRDSIERGGTLVSAKIGRALITYLSGSGAPAVDPGEVVLEFGVAELVDGPRLAQDLAVVGVL